MRIENLQNFLQRVEEKCADDRVIESVSNLKKFFDEVDGSLTVKQVLVKRRNKIVPNSMSKALMSDLDVGGLLSSYLSSLIEIFGLMIKRTDKSSLERLLEFLDQQRGAPEFENIGAISGGLERAGTDRAKFEHVIALLEEVSSKFSLDDMHELTMSYTRSKKKPRSKKAAIDQLSRHFEAGAQMAARRQVIARM